MVLLQYSTVHYLQGQYMYRFVCRQEIRMSRGDNGIPIWPGWSQEAAGDKPPDILVMCDDALRSLRDYRAHLEEQISLVDQAQTMCRSCRGIFLTAHHSKERRPPRCVSCERVPPPERGLGRGIAL